MTDESSVKLVWITPQAEKVIGYCARVSNPANQNNEDVAGLLKYCMTHGHWSIFEQASMCIEIKTSRAISAQILRHKSFSFQEFSQRYAKAVDVESYPARRQDTKNRQNSINDVSLLTQLWWEDAQKNVKTHVMKLYETALEKGIAKECARMILPMATSTTLYMSGSIRSWIHYLKLRCDKSTQLEHRIIADEIKQLLIKELPVIGSLLENTTN